MLAVLALLLALLLGGVEMREAARGMKSKGSKPAYRSWHSKKTSHFLLPSSSRGPKMTRTNTSSVLWQARGEPC